MAAAVSIYEEIEDRVLRLTRAERSQLATRLLESLDEDDDIEVSPEWREELRRRVRDIDEGRTELVDKGQVWELVNKRFGTNFGA